MIRLRDGVDPKLPLATPTGYAAVDHDCHGVHHSPARKIEETLNFMAASPAYTMFTGFAEVLAGCLLFYRRTTMLGALLGAGVMSHVLALNLCYDVPAKLFSARLLLMSVFLLLPETRRLIDFFVLHRPIEAREFPPLVQWRWLKARKLNMKDLYFTCLIVLTLALTRSYWMPKEPTKTPLEGIWEVDEFKLDHQTLPPLTTDKKRWRHLILQDDRMGFVRPMSGERVWQQCAIDPTTRTLKLTPFGDKKDPLPWAVLTFAQPEPDQLTLSGSLDSQAVELKLHLVPASKFPLISRGFHWINEYPFNR